MKPEQANFQLFEPDAPLAALEMRNMAKMLMAHFYRWSSILSELYVSSNHFLRIRTQPRLAGLVFQMA